jgi:hypothetical protein
MNKEYLNINKNWVEASSKILYKNSISVTKWQTTAKTITGAMPLIVANERWNL